MKSFTGGRNPSLAAPGRLVAAALLSLSLANTAAESGTAADLGRALFFDVNLSVARTQSCATCHDPAAGFHDPRDNGVKGAASLGGDGRSLGDRNTPALAYVAHTPELHRDAEGHYRGGLFHDGRAVDLAHQAVEPIVNPLEMAQADAAATAARVRENPAYVESFTALYGAAVWSSPENVLAAIGDSIAAFEQTALFSPYDSKYDRYLRGEYTLSALEEMGRSLFFSPLTNCSTCHMQNRSSLKDRETFSNYRYHNIGLPVNRTLRARNGLGDTHRDPGLLANPAVDDPALAGKFKVPSLRNVAVTAPYMHNGVFQELATAIVFYNQYTVNSRQSRTNPETGDAWGDAEFPQTVDTELLSQGQPIDAGRAQALIAFLKTLTDARYEHLLDRAGAVPSPR
ncbi:MAG: cytochrome-c peroxidase [Gammaproteobacteria bacterium]|jgi:cytochrome c peroxidase